MHSCQRQDGNLTNINFMQKVVDPKNLKKNILEGFQVGRRAEGMGKVFNFPKEISDVNIWNFALEDDIMKKWTDCR